MCLRNYAPIMGLRRYAPLIHASPRRLSRAGPERSTPNMCTSFTIGSADSGFIYGRTMEFTLDLKSQVMVVPKGTSMTATGKDGEVGKGGLTWESSHGWVGTNALGLDDDDRRHERARPRLRRRSTSRPRRSYLQVSDDDQPRSIASFGVGAFCCHVRHGRGGPAGPAARSRPGREVGRLRRPCAPASLRVHDADGGRS